MPIFAAAVFFSAFLLFALQPMVAKFLLPSFGGTAAVWATCMVVFQTLLLAGYAYAHWLRTKLSPRQQRWTHVAALLVALFFLPPVPNVNIATAVAHPAWELLHSVFTSVGVPFFALAATAPLLMEWFRQAFPNRTPDRLYAFSNAGSLLALISYPALIEPRLGGKTQSLSWAGAMLVFLTVCGVVAWWSEKQRKITASQPAFSPIKADSKTKMQDTPAWLWVALSACGSALLLALTNQITQDVAPMPLLWVAPLGVYLLSFILCFESSRFYHRWLFMPASFGAFMLLAWMLQEGYLQGFWPQVVGYLSILFCGCMLCHGELYRLRPSPEKLTAFYLSLSLGGALGGIFVALIAPSIFPMILETPLVAIGIAALTVFILNRDKSPFSRRLPLVKAAFFCTLCLASALGYAINELRAGSIHYARSFYGTYRVKEGPRLRLDNTDYPLDLGVARVLYSGQIYHGLQFTRSQASSIPTTYYGEDSGLGLTFRALDKANRKVGAVGLGAGTLAAYGRPGDHFRFYELDQTVLRIAETYFTFLSNCPAHIEIVLGDGRLSLEHESAQNFDLLVLDAFSGDSIPVHLLTSEAMKTYRRHLSPSGVIAFHISNSHVNLEPVVRALAIQQGFHILFLPPQQTDPKSGKLASMWMLLSSNEEFFHKPEFSSHPRYSTDFAPMLWTDDYSSVMPILH